MEASEFIRKFVYGEGYVALAYGNVQATKFVKHTEVPNSFPSTDVFFGPALRKQPGNKKEHVEGSIVLWVDADDPQRPLATLPPSMVVFSGHGWHLYWLLNAPISDTEEVERLNKLLAEDVPTGDGACWNVNRVLRVPGTVNNKDPQKPVNVELRGVTPYVYTSDDIKILAKLNRPTRHKISTGDSRGYRSRSERDWAIVTALVDSGARDELITLLFDAQPCGDKAREGPKDYLSRTIEKARNRRSTRRGQQTQAQPQEDGYIVEGSDGYYVPSRRGMRRVSTFTIDPTMLLDGNVHGAEDAVVGRVKASGYTWPDVTFSRSAFTSVSRLDRECPVAAWQWLGRDEDVRQLLPFLLDRLRSEGLPRVNASPVLGLHFVNGVPYFVGTSQVVGTEQVWQGYDGPMAWLPTKKEHPQLRLETDIPAETLAALGHDVPLLNEPETIWPMIGWYAATPLKPWLEERGYRFPILNVAGTKGSGKTSLIQRVFMPMLGQTDAKSYDANTTRFVVLALLGSTNAIPIAFSEFRYEAVEKFLRIVLLSYDTGHDPRGRGDQTTIDYALTAPFSVDGEDLIEDPAARERLVVAQMHPNVIEEGSQAYHAFQRARTLLQDSYGFGGYYVQYVIRKIKDGSAEQLLNDCRDKVYDAFPSKLPDRVRLNHVLAYFGCALWSQAVGIEVPEPSVLKGSISSVYDLTTGRSRTLVDAMVEDIANECAKQTQQFKWRIKGESTLYFQLSSAHGWWIQTRRRQGRGALERDAIRSQLREAAYALDAQMIDDVYMFGVDLRRAQELGLDVPGKIVARQFTVQF